MTAVEVRHLKSSVYGEMDNKKYFTKITLKWDFRQEKENKWNRCLYEVVGNGRKREKRHAPLYFIVGSFQIDKKSLKRLLHN